MRAVEMDLAIIGGGAAGLASAIFAAETAAAGTRIVVIDSAVKLGAKILVSGGGRCNVTHDVVTPEDFNGSRNVVRNILAAFGVKEAVAWFESLGVELKREETGKLFPVADTAKVIVEALLRRCATLNVEMLTGCRVTEISVSKEIASEPTREGEAPAEPRISNDERLGGSLALPKEVRNHPPSAQRGDAKKFTITHTNGSLRCDRVIFCTGGKSLPRTGSDGGGWEIVRKLGHTVTPTYAALVPLVMSPPMFHAELAGISMDVELSVVVGNRRIDQRTGSLLWTHFGISGPVVMDASRHWTIAREAGEEVKMLCNLLPGETFETLEKWLVQTVTARPKAALLTLLSERLPKRVVAEVIRHVGVDGAMPAGQLSRDARRTLVHGFTALVLPISQHRGWNYAEVTAGGVPLNEIDFRTMQSRKVPGLYLAGEVLDCDGRIGGYNFQWAWATGYLAGRAAANPKA